MMTSLETGLDATGTLKRIIPSIEGHGQAHLLIKLNEVQLLAVQKH